MERYLNFFWFRSLSNVKLLNVLKYFRASSLDSINTFDVFVFEPRPSEGGRIKRYLNNPWSQLLRDVELLDVRK